MSAFDCGASTGLGAFLASVVGAAVVVTYTSTEAGGGSAEVRGTVMNVSTVRRAIEGTEKPLNTPDQALALMKIIDAIYESSNTGKPVAC